jgi:hypothetical protein
MARQPYMGLGLLFPRLWVLCAFAAVRDRPTADWHSIGYVLSLATHCNITRQINLSVTSICEILGSHSGVAEDAGPLGCYTVTGRLFPDISKALRSFKMSGTTHLITLRHISEDLHLTWISCESSQVQALGCSIYLINIVITCQWIVHLLHLRVQYIIFPVTICLYNCLSRLKYIFNPLREAIHTKMQTPA